jgi:hypothetical protein
MTIKELKLIIKEIKETYTLTEQEQNELILRIIRVV